MFEINSMLLKSMHSSKAKAFFAKRHLRAGNSPVRRVPEGHRWLPLAMSRAIHAGYRSVSGTAKLHGSQQAIGQLLTGTFDHTLAT
jgi:hypothetical protein